MIIKKLIFVLVFLSLTNCGYEPIYSKKENLNISINKIEFVGDKNINRSIVTLVNLRETKNTNYSYDVNLNSSKNTEAVSKDAAGNITSFKVTIVVKFSLKDPNDKGTVIKSKNFRTSFIYNNKKNKFDLMQYKKSIEKNLIEKIAEEIAIYINS